MGASSAHTGAVAGHGERGAGARHEAARTQASPGTTCPHSGASHISGEPATPIGGFPDASHGNRSMKQTADSGRDAVAVPADGVRLPGRHCPPQ
jgi:hypothetical protein